jgi:hypothetical protein
MDKKPETSLADRLARAAAGDFTDFMSEDEAPLHGDTKEAQECASILLPLLRADLQEDPRQLVLPEWRHLPLLG